MTDKLHSVGRRKILGDGMRLAAALTITSLVPAIATTADKAPKVSTDDPLAKSLKYVEDASKADSAAHKKGQHCATCNLYKGKEGSEWGPCQAFQNKLVHSQGWCTAFVAKSG